MNKTNNHLLEVYNAFDDSRNSSGDAATESLNITFATYNIRYGVGAFLISGSYLRRLGFARRNRRARLITKHIGRAARAFNFSDNRMSAPHIIALQEADKMTRRAGGLHIARELAERLRMNFAHAASDLPRETVEQPKVWWLDFEEHIEATEAGDTGVGVLSCFELRDVERLELPCAACRWRPRTAIKATIALGKTKLHIYNAHVDTHATTDTQLEQHQAILNCIEAQTMKDEAVIYAGDFNTLSRAGAVRVREFLEANNFTTPFATGTTTWKAGFIKLHTDWIFTRHLNITNYGTRKWLGVSDHYPVWVTFDGREFYD